MIYVQKFAFNFFKARFLDILHIQFLTVAVAATERNRKELNYARFLLNALKKYNSLH